MRKSLFLFILAAIFIPLVLSGYEKKQETAEPTSSETSYENELTQSES